MLCHLQAATKRMRNKLSLAERMDVIRRYENKASVRSLAVIFKCGRTQIKSILRNRNYHLMSWLDSEKQKYDRGSNAQSPVDEPVNRILHEWVKRAQCYQINITDEILLSFGQEIADHLHNKDFVPSNEWLVDFKQRYQLFNIGLNVKQEPNVLPEERKPLSIAIIIDDLQGTYGNSVIPAVNQTQIPDCYGERSESVGSFDGIASGSFYSMDEMLEHEDDSAVQVDDDDLTNSSSGKPSTMCEETSKEIGNYKEALNHLGPLERFALLKENIRAVGLINQLENLFRAEMEKTELQY